MPTIKTTTRRPWLPEKKPYDGMQRGINYNLQAWKRLSLAKRKANPICEECQRKGIIKSAYCVDHIVPINQGGDPWAWDNLQSLCRKCHDKKTAKEGSKK